MLSIFGCCCGYYKLNDKFQQMYTCTNHQGWELPSQETITQLLNSLKGQNRQVKKVQAEAIIFNHLSLCKFKQQITFLLKNLLITDRVVDQLLLIQQISKYQLQLKLPPSEEINSNQPLDKINRKLNLVAYYYFQYIKAKASIYCQFNGIIGDNYKQIHPSPTFLIKLIQNSLKLNEYVMEINSGYKSLNYFYKQRHLLKGIMLRILKIQLKFYRIMMIAFYHLLQCRDSFENNPQRIKQVKKLLIDFNTHFVKNCYEIFRDNSKIQVPNYNYGFQNIIEIQEIPNDYVKLFNDLILGDVPPILKYDSLEQQDGIVQSIRQNSNLINGELKKVDQIYFSLKDKVNKTEQSTIQNQLSRNIEENHITNNEQYYNQERSSDSTDHQKNKSKSQIKYSIKQNEYSDEDQQQLNDPELLKSFQLPINLSKQNYTI